MQLIDQHVKAIMEGCKRRALDAGLRFQEETLEYIVSNRDLLELGPKGMIPTLYDFWVHDVEVFREKGKYELYPHNPYETVINTRPAISFYNDNNPDWLNVMIFYHVLAHIDFFQNNVYFRHTWHYDFNGQALSDKRVVSRLRAERGRWADYVIEFARGVDNLVGYHEELARLDRPHADRRSKRLDWYFDVFLQAVKKVRANEYLKEIERYNRARREFGEGGDASFFLEVDRQHPEFKALFEKSLARRDGRRLDLMQHLMEHSPFLAKEENRWMRTLLQVVRTTSLFFQPQIRTKIMNEGWASYWHEELFLTDDRIAGHEVDFARVNAWVTALPRVGLNPYALGLRLFRHLERESARGRYTFAFDRLRDSAARTAFGGGAGEGEGDGRDFIFQVRANHSDFTFLNTFVDQDFVTRERLFVAGRRLDRDRLVWQYYVKSRKAEDYRQMLLDQLYHPPHIVVDPAKGDEGTLYLVHRFEGRPLVTEYVANALLGIEYLWGAPVHLETSEPERSERGGPGEEPPEPEPLKWRRVVYTMKDRKLQRRLIG